MLSKRVTQLSPQQLNELARLMLKCATMQNPSGRAQVIGALQPAIRNAAPSSGSMLIDLVGLLNTCQNYENGIAELIGVLRNYEDGSIPMKAVDAFIQNMPPNVKPKHQEEDDNRTKPSIVSIMLGLGVILALLWLAWNQFGNTDQASTSTPTIMTISTAPPPPSPPATPTPSSLAIDASLPAVPADELPRRLTRVADVQFRAPPPCQDTLQGWLSDVKARIEPPGTAPATAPGQAIALIEQTCSGNTAATTITLAPSFDPILYLPEPPPLTLDGDSDRAESPVKASVLLALGRYPEASAELRVPNSARECLSSPSSAQVEPALAWITGTAALRQEQWILAHDWYLCGAQEQSLSAPDQSRFLVAAALTGLMAISSDPSALGLAELENLCVQTREHVGRAIALDPSQSEYVLLEARAIATCGVENNENALAMVTERVKRVLDEADSADRLLQALAFSVQAYVYVENDAFTAARVCAEQARTRNIYLAEPALILGIVYGNSKDSTLSREYFAKAKEWSTFNWQRRSVEQKQTAVLSSPSTLDVPIEDNPCTQ